MNSTHSEHSGVRRLNEHVESVLSGATKASKKVQLACKRHLEDLERSRDPNYPWRFDEARAERPIQFMERFLTPMKGNYDRMQLMPWQCFVEGSIYGWVSKANGLRRYREGLIVVGRGNGKTTLMAGNASYGASKDGERGADVFLLANSKEQAAICFEESRSQIMASPALAPHFRTLRDGIHYDATNSRIMHRASDSKKLDGLNPYMAIFDEIHQFRDFKLINVIKRGMNKRHQPLALYITTMGTVLDGPLMAYYHLFTDAMMGNLRPEISDRMFGYICELDEEDDVNDESTWIKANPALGVLLDPQQLHEDWERAKLNPQERSDFINKQLDVFTNAGDAAYVDHEIIERNMGTIASDELFGRECYGGFDLSASEDFTSAALEFPLDDGRLFVLSHTWVPQKKVDLDQEKIPYYEYAMAGYLTICPGEYITQETVFDWFCAQAERYSIRTIGYDPANATWLVRMLQAKGFDCTPVRQGPLTLNAPMKDIREQLLDGHIVFNGNPLMRWYLDNVRLRRDFYDREKENWVPTKRDRYRKIDGFMAFLDAHAEYMRLNPLANVDLDAAISIYSLA